MKKKISIVLVLAMVLSIFSGFVYAETSEKDIFDVIDLIGLNEILDGKDLALAIFNEYLTDDKIEELEEKVTSYEDLKDGLATDGVTRPMVRELITLAEELTVNDLDDIQAVKEEAISILGNEIVERMVDTRNNKSNSEFAYDLINRIISKIDVVKYDTHAKTFTINFSKYANDAILKGYLDKVFPTTFPSQTISYRLETAESVLTYILNEDESFDTYKDDLLDLLEGYEGKFYSTYSTEPGEEPGNGGGSGGSGGSGGGGSATDPKLETPIVEKPKVQDGKAQVELGKDAVEVKEGSEGQTVVSVKAENIKAAVESLMAAIKEAPNAKPVVTIKLDDVKTAAMEVSLPKEAMKILYENKVELVIESEALSYEVPAEALEYALKDIAEDAQIEFKSKVVSVEEAKKLFNDENVANTAKVIEFNLLIKDKNGNEISKINKFSTKIRIGIELEEKDGNPDLLAVFHINEETNKLDFVGGKIKGNKIYMTTDHYSKFAVVEYDKSFSDIENHWSKDYVKSMIAKHIVDGFAEENLYKPEDKLTRAQFAKLLVETLELEKVTFKGEFTDVNDKHWARDYIATAKQEGIIGGYDDGTFKPDQSVTRAEMAAMLTNSLDLEKKALSIVLNQFKDVNDVPTWAVEYMVPVVQEKLLVGSNGELKPLGKVTRAEAATIIYRVYNK